MEYVFLAIAIVSEVIATSYLKQTEGFTKLIPSLICAAAYIVCHYTFAKSAPFIIKCERSYYF